MYLDATLCVAPLGTVFGDVDGGPRVTRSLAHGPFTILGLDVLGFEVVQLRQVAKYVKGIEIHQNVIRRVDKIHRIDDVVISRRRRR